MPRKCSYVPPLTGAESVTVGKPADPVAADQARSALSLQTFTRLYPNLMRDFMYDDHNHSDSVTSLSVQIYTVPTVAYLLIANEDCLSIVTRTFYNECVHRRNARECTVGR